MIIATTTPSRRFAGRFLKETEALFVQVLELAREMGLLKLGTVALDDTKMHWRSARLPAVWDGVPVQRCTCASAPSKNLFQQPASLATMPAWSSCRITL
jgi:hypothetical protein